MTERKKSNGKGDCQPDISVLKSELREIEVELDKSSPWENPPYRNERRKLNRRKETILMKIKKWVPEPEPKLSKTINRLRNYQSGYSDLDDRQKVQYREARVVGKLLEILKWDKEGV